MGPMKHFKHKGVEYVRCMGCLHVGLLNWAHTHTRDVDGQEIAGNWYRSVEELQRSLNRPPPKKVHGVVALGRLFKRR